MGFITKISSISNEWADRMGKTIFSLANRQKCSCLTFAIDASDSLGLSILFKVPKVVLSKFQIQGMACIS